MNHKSAATWGMIMPTVLVVDDSAVDRRLVGGLLSKAGDLRAEYATDGKDALAKLDALDLALIVTDLVMPEMNGLELVSAVVERHPHVPVILMTGKGSEEIAVQALQAGAASYVPKSALRQYLVQTVHDVLAMMRDKRSHQKLMESLNRGEFTFVMGNDSSLIPSLISYVQSLVCSIGLCDESSVIRVCIALEEAMRNALFHGNLELTSEQREGDAATYESLVSKRVGSLPYRDRQLHVRVRISPQSGTFIVRDEGPGFDPTQLPDPTDPENLEKVSGRGLLLMRTFMDDVQFNSTGNEVTMIKRAAEAREPRSQEAVT